MNKNKNKIFILTILSILFFISVLNILINHGLLIIRQIDSLLTAMYILSIICTILLVIDLIYIIIPNKK